MFIVCPCWMLLLLLFNLALGTQDLGFSLQPVSIQKSDNMYFCLLWEHAALLPFSLLISAIIRGLHYWQDSGQLFPRPAGRPAPSSLLGQRTLLNVGLRSTAQAREHQRKIFCLRIEYKIGVVHKKEKWSVYRLWTEPCLCGAFSAALGPCPFLMCPALPQGVPAVWWGPPFLLEERGDGTTVWLTKYVFNMQIMGWTLNFSGT